MDNDTLNKKLFLIKEATLDYIHKLFNCCVLTTKQWQSLLLYRYGYCDLITLRREVKKVIQYYDQSEYVNSFYYNDNQYWLSKDTRIGLIRLLDSGATEVTLQLSDIYVTIKAAKLRDFLNKLEVYAGQCFTATAKHIQEVNGCTTIEDLLNIDYTKDYPEKLVLNVD